MLSRVTVVDRLTALGGRAHRSEILGAGITTWDLRCALQSGQIERCSRGVYRLATDFSSDDLDLAVKATRGIVSHDTAAAMHGYDCVHKIGWHLTIPPGRRGRYPGYTVHREAIIGGVHIVSGLPTTSPLQTVIGCAKILPLREATVIADSAMRAGLSHDLLARHVAHLKGAHSGKVRKVADASDPRSGSVAETLARVLFLEHRLPRPQTQRHFDGLYRSDFTWPHHRVVVEIDGYEFHRDKASFGRDRRITNTLQLDGWLVLRFTWDDVTLSPRYLLRTVRQALVNRDQLAWGAVAEATNIGHTTRKRSSRPRPS